jgi:hypothetical protein
MSHEVIVDKKPHCDFCQRNSETVDAEYDAATTIGPWANMCQSHFETFGIGLGTGRGQKLILRPKLKPQKPIAPGGSVQP